MSVANFMGKRVISIFSVCCILFTGLYLRIGSIISDDFYAETGKEQSSYILTLPTGRGNILDANMTPMVNQSYEYVAAVLPTKDNFQLMVKHSAEYTEEELRQLYVKQKPFLTKVNTYQILDENVQVFPVYSRYGESQLAPHVIGYLDSENKGVAGIEKAYESLLTENITPTTIRYTLDGAGSSMVKRKPEIQYGTVPNTGVVLTIDQEIQAICEQAGNKYLKKGAVVVMDCQTGELKAVCSFPDFSLDSLAESINDTENSPMINRAFTPTSVGSTFKIVTTTAALSSGWDLGQTYECTGVFNLADQKFHCHQRQGQGVLDLKNALMVSCNPFFINLGLSLDPKAILTAANDLSFGKQYELAPGLFTQSGIVPTLEELQNPGQIANLSFGQGILSATPVQMAQMVSAACNGGYTPTPILVKGFTTDGETLTQQNEPSRIQAMSPEAAAILKEYLIACVMDREAQLAKPSNVTAGGKTATAQTGIFIDGEEQDNGGFVGFFPAEEPKYAVAVVSENAETGNENASPVFREIAEAMSALNK